MDRRRLAIAFAISIALHEIAAGVVPSNFAARPAQRESVTRVRIVRVARRAAPTPHPLRIHVVYHPTHVSTHQIAHARAGAHIARAKPVLTRPVHSKPVWDIASNSGAGVVHAATASGAAGEGAQVSDAGAGAPNRGEPCGFVTFSDPHGSQFDPQTHGFWVDIRMSVHFADGASQSIVLDYPWYYASETDNPWSDANRKDPTFPTRFQTPPPQKLGGEPALVKYVIGHSTPDGMTLLHECPKPLPTPAA